MAPGTKQKDSFLSMFARNNEQEPEQNDTQVNVSVVNDQPQGYEQTQVAESNQVTIEPQQPPEESEEEGQLNIDVYQTEEDIVIKSAISGVKAEDLDINIQNDMVTVRGTRRPNEIIDPDDYYYQECFWGTFSRAVILPVDIDPENVRAELEDGILTVRLPKAEKIKNRKIQVVEK